MRAWRHERGRRGRHRLEGRHRVAVWPMAELMGYLVNGAWEDRAEVYVAEIDESIWDRAREAGAVRVAKSIIEFADVELDVSIDYAGFSVTTADALKTVKSTGGGRVVQVGMGKLEATIDTHSLILGR